MAEAEEARFVYGLALRLGRTVAEILDLPSEELAGWSAYLAHLENEREHHERKARR